MKLKNIVSRVTVDPRKLTDYALDPENPIGRHKAYVFEQVLGFTKENHEILLEQIERDVLTAEARLKRVDLHGRHYAVDLDVTGLQGQQAVVRTGWLVVPGSDEAWLTTLYVRKREKDEG
jgi:hypothetical protein